MRYPEIDKRTKKDILKHIRKTSAAYTPEWRFDDENPDIGTALSFVFADMFSETIKRFNRVPEKNLSVFLNSTGAKLLPAMPATGYVTFGLVNQSVEGIEVRKGTQLIAETQEAELQSITFETGNDMYVTPAVINHIYYTEGTHDIISHIYQNDIFKTNPEPFLLYNLHATNLQEHILYFSHDTVFKIKGEAIIGVYFNSMRTNDILKNFDNGLKKGDIIFEYFTDQGFCEFSDVKLEEDRLNLYKTKEQMVFSRTAINDLESYWIRCTVKNINSVKNSVLESITVQSTGVNLLPEIINANGIEQDISEFFPFGERMVSFSECYIASEEVLCKKGALIGLSFTMDFIKVPLENTENESSLNWKLVMKRSDFIPDSEYDITIEEVIWEYYNENGWSRLFLDTKYSTVFNAKNGTLGQVITLSFVCPEDITPILVSSKYSYYIRARILKVNNAFKQKGAYITPLLSEVSFQYSYLQGGRISEHILMKNNLEEEYRNGLRKQNSKSYFHPFKGIEDTKGSLYLGFHIPPLNGPIKILFNMLETMEKKMPRLTYEYYAKGRWNPLNVIDETHNMRTTGIITMMGNKDFEQHRLWGQDLYWIRIIDSEEVYSNSKKKNKLPSISGIHMNATNVMAVETMDPERFFIAPKQENLTCILLNQKIFSITVWVNEASTLSIQGVGKIEKTHTVRYVYDKNGDIIEIWVKWDEVEDFSISGKDDRHYVVDKNEGILKFSNGFVGAIPPSGDRETILVKYSCGGGTIGNLEPGQINRLNRSLGFVNSIFNSENTTGGCNQETTSEALKRNAAVLKHGYRAVTAADYESLAMEATRNILKAKCFSNCNEFGQRDYGNVTLVILQKDYKNGRKYFEQVKKQVMDYMQDKISSNLIELNKFHVVEPTFLELCIQVTISIGDINMVFDTKEKVNTRLQSFIDPMIGNFGKRGWEIGRIPNTTQILNALKDIPEVMFVKNVVMTAYKNGDFGKVEVDLDIEENNQFAIAVNGIHEIIILIE